MLKRIDLAEGSLLPLYLSPFWAAVNHWLAHEDCIYSASLPMFVYDFVIPYIVAIVHLSMLLKNKQKKTKNRTAYKDKLWIMER